MNPTLAHPLFVALKSALAALLALAAVGALGIPDRLSAAFVAVVCISPSVFSGVRRGADQLLASAFGGALVWGLALLLPDEAALAVALFATIWLAFRLGLARAVPVASFTVLYVVLLDPQPGHTAILAHRLGSVAVGVGAALAVNLVVSTAQWRRVFARRLNIARQAVAAEWRTLAKGQGEPFEQAFPLLRALEAELADALQESRVRGGKTAERLEAARRACRHLIACAHYGKDLWLQQRREAVADSGLAAQAEALAAAVERLEPAPSVTQPPAALVLALAEWSQAQGAEQQFRAP